VTVPNLGVVNGDGGFGNATVIFASQTSGAVTTVTYGAIGDCATDTQLGPLGILVPSE
jgi:hypothetical protein